MASAIVDLGRFLGMAQHWTIDLFGASTFEIFAQACLMSYLGHMTTQPIESAGNWFEFGLKDRLRKSREETGLSRAAFADLTGIARNTVLNYEHGKTKPNAIYLRTWADATGTDLEWLKTGATPVTRQSLSRHTAPVVSIWTAPSRRPARHDFIPSQQAG